VVAMNRADRKAKIAQARASARRHPVPMLVEESDGWHYWQVGKVLTVMPALLRSAPSSVRRSYQSRIIANATGICPRCESIGVEPADNSNYAPFRHHDHCPVLKTNFQRWIRRAAA
jgi:hypothetical protein